VKSFRLCWICAIAANDLTKCNGDNWGVRPQNKRGQVQFKYQLFFNLYLIPINLEIERQSVDRNSAIISAYATGAYSQREIGNYFHLHPSTVGVIVRRNNNSLFGT